MTGLTAKELQDITLSVGTHRGARRLSPLEVAQLIDKALSVGTSRIECARILGISPTQVSTFLRLLALKTEIQHLADWRVSKNASVPFSTLAELSRLSPEDQVKAAEAILRNDLKWKEVVQLTQISDRSGKSIEECIASVLALRPQVETRYLFVGAVLTETLKVHLKSISQTKRDQMIDQVLRRLVGPSYGARGRLSDREFTVLSQHDLTRLLDMSADQIEHAVNESLEGLRERA